MYYPGLQAGGPTNAIKPGFSPEQKSFRLKPGSLCSQDPRAEARDNFNKPFITTF